MLGTYIIWSLPETELATNKSKVRTICHLHSIQIFQNKSPAYKNEVFRPAQNTRINTRNSYFKLSRPFRKTSTGQNNLSYIGPAIWNKIPEILKKNKNLNTFKHKMKHYYLNELSNPNLWNIGGFDYVFGYHKEHFSFH